MVWEEQRRVYGCLIHVDIINNQIWIQYDVTEYSVANEVVDVGVPKHDIFLAYKTPFMRQYTGFAVS